LRFATPYPRPLLALVLCGLVSVGGVPQIGCICPSGESCFDCLDCAPVISLITGSAPQPSHDCCCTQKTDSKRHDDGIQTAGSGSCQCEKFARQSVISNPPRTAVCKSIVVFRDFGDASFADLDFVIAPRRSLESDRVPPDDPVSRAQILRL